MTVRWGFCRRPQLAFRSDLQDTPNAQTSGPEISIFRISSLNMGKEVSFWVAPDRIPIALLA
jgi:hypothetical protein